MKATIISDESGWPIGVVVRLEKKDAMHIAPLLAAKSEACLALSNSSVEPLDAIDALRKVNRMSLEIGWWRWVPRDDGNGRRPHLELADPCSVGSWAGAYWSEPW